ncbi:MAG: 30S ribosomal protein S12 methylthiotransferase RimO [Bacteroidales bacterium]
MKRLKSRSINIVTMGCSKNLVDSEFILARFANAGWKVEFDAPSSGQDLVIINTCGFIGDARQESIDMILEYAGAKTNGRIGKLCVMGCLSQKYKDELLKEIPEADLILGVDALEELTRIFELDQARCAGDERLISTPSHYAYLKISEGCDRSCSFCSIPEIRGQHISRPLESLVKEAAQLAGKGVKELIIIAQDITWYGYDLYNKQMLVPLLKELQTIRGIEWIRLHYAFPSGFPEDLLDLMNESKIICRYLDIPLQHISDNMLQKMRRGISREKTIYLINKIREKVPGIAIRTTMLAGHPGETEEDIDELKEFVKNSRFERLGVFPYSHEENTYSYNKYKDLIPDRIKNRRVSEIMLIQQEISANLNNERVGQVLKVLIDREDDEYYYARTEFDSPEVDNEVIIKNNGLLGAGQFCMVRITDAGEFDLFAEVLP